MQNLGNNFKKYSNIKMKLHKPPAMKPTKSKEHNASLVFNHPPMM